MKKTTKRPTAKQKKVHNVVSKMTKLMTNPKVTAKCVDCNKTKEFGPGDVPNGELPMCECGSFMLAVSAKAT